MKRAAMVVLCMAAILPFLLAEDGPPPIRRGKGPPPTKTEGPPPVHDRGQPKLSTTKWVAKGYLYNPDDCVTAAAADIAVLSKTMSAEALSYIRYLAVYNYPEDMRDAVYAVTSFTLNSLNYEGTEIFPPVRGGPGSILIRVNLRDYYMDPAVWDRLGEKDPYFHQPVLEKNIKQTVAVQELKATTVTQTSSKYVEISFDRDEGARVWIDDYLTKTNSLVSPELPSGKEFTYTFKVESGGQAVTRVVKVSAGTKIYIDLRQRKVATKSEEVGQAKERIYHAAWLNKDTIATLIKHTQSTAPILRADWFVIQATQPPFYYDFLKIKKLDDFLDIVAFDKRAVKKETRATIVTSGLRARDVSRNNRILGRDPTFNGYLWQTFDFETSTGAKNVINNFLQLKEDGKGGKVQRDAGEYIGSAHNGLQLYALVNGKDEIVAEGAIAVVTENNFPDHRVINGRSCIVCHSSGINNFDSHFQKQVGYAPDKADLAVFDKDPKRAMEIQEYIRKTFGTPNFDTIIAEDNRIYEKAIKACHGLTPEANASLFRTLWLGMQEERLDLGRAAYECGLDVADLEKVAAMRLNGYDNGVLIQMLLKPPIVIRRDQWEEVFPELMLRAVAYRALPRVADSGKGR